MTSPRVRRALLSVSDKQGLIQFAEQLHRAGVELYSTGGTRKHLEAAGLPVVDVATYTGFPEMMDGRVKTLHPRIFAGILCRHDRADDMAALEKHAIATFELVVVNLYPFAQTIAKPDVTLDEAIENIDIGGPSLVRAAAKNHAFTTIVTTSERYDIVASQIANQGSTTLELRQQLMAEAFAHTADYDRAIAAHFQKQFLSQEPTSHSDELPESVRPSLQRVASLRYGENPHQRAALYRWKASEQATLVDATQLHGKELSYNNYLDLDAAWKIACGLPDAAVSVVKHNNPCGAASAVTIDQACRKAMEGDPVSAFGSILAFNREVDAASAEYLATPGLFVEAIVAPGFSSEAIEILTTRPKWKSNVRLLRNAAPIAAPRQIEWRQIDGGFLAQDADTQIDQPNTWKVVTKHHPDASLMRELEFGWAVCRFVKSNAITVSRDRALCGAGAGQMSRVDSVEIALRKAGERSQGAVLASDAFFPFPDSIAHAAQAGIAAIIQPGGSKRDEEVIQACNEVGIPMLFTGVRHFRH